MTPLSSYPFVERILYFRFNSYIRNMDFTPDDIIALSKVLAALIIGVVSVIYGVKPINIFRNSKKKDDEKV